MSASIIPPLPRILSSISLFRSSSLFLCFLPSLFSLCHSLFLLYSLVYPLASRASSRFSATRGWLRFSLSYNTSFSLSLSFSRKFSLFLHTSFSLFLSSCFLLSLFCSPPFLSLPFVCALSLFLFLSLVHPQTTLVHSTNALSPCGAHGARRSVIFKPFAL